MKISLFIGTYLLSIFLSYSLSLFVFSFFFCIIKCNLKSLEKKLQFEKYIQVAWVVRMYSKLCNQAHDLKFDYSQEKRSVT